MPRQSLPEFVSLTPDLRKAVPSGHISTEWLAGNRCPCCSLPGSGGEDRMRCANGCEPSPEWVPGTTYLKIMKM